ncbi:expressed unknown protein [Seminavis robusta]|uniref:Uncharacterized protein n=1 Tax=Seminavis robusta TaxID=568900 RepID=A0A9N8DGN1_9STRA|nr:expressed unknown protein [Seminavis robusta]|eukprot:Sro142_g066300.1 n/a (683) ;mRNA; f:69558-71685
MMVGNHVLLGPGPLLLLLLAVLSQEIAGFVPSHLSVIRIKNNEVSCPIPLRSDDTPSNTVLQMGLRNFIKKKVLRRNNEDPSGGNDNSSSKSAASGTGMPNKDPTGGSRKDTNKIIQNAAATKAAKSQPPKKVRMGEDPATGEIDVESSKLGPETVQERISRIKRGDMSAAEKQAFLQSALSTGNTPESRLPMMGRSDANTPQSASPFPTDSILRNMAMGNKKDNGTNTSSGSKTRRDVPLEIADSQSKKRKYLDMVTDPHRFDNYQNLQKKGTNEAANGEDNGGDAEAENNNEAQQPNVPLDLGARLGAHAMETVKRNKEIRERQEEKERQMEEHRRAREKRLAEAQVARQAEMTKREMDIQQRRQANDQELQKNSQQNNLAEEARRSELMKAQDDYWAKKLAENKRAEEAKEEAVKAREEKEKEQEERKRAAVAAAAAAAAEENGEDSNTNANTLESLNDVAQARGNNMVNQASEASGRSSLNDLPLRGSSEQDRRQAGLEDQQLQALRSLNSPLPKPASGPKKRTTLRKPPTFQPQKPVTARSQTPAQSLGDLTNTIKNPTRVSNDNQNEQAAPAPAKPEPTRPPQDEAVGRSFNPFSRLGGGGRNGKTPPAAKAPPSPPARKGPIRMELPLGDEDDEEPAMTEGMTIGEIMKRQKAASNDDQDTRSKQWGVDMSRFQE